jgi:hypothetical protein
VSALDLDLDAAEPKGPEPQQDDPRDVEVVGDRRDALANFDQAPRPPSSPCAGDVSPVVLMQAVREWRLAI